MSTNLFSGERAAATTTLNAKSFSLTLLGIGLAMASCPQSSVPAQQAAGVAVPSFEVASIKPNHSGEGTRGWSMQRGGFIAKNATAKSLIAFAYLLKEFQVSGGPGWINSEGYDVQAKAEDAVVGELQQLPPRQRAERMALMVQALLADRFKLKVHRGTGDLPIYVLVVAKNGPRLQESKPGDTYPNGIKRPDGQPLGRGYGIEVGWGQITGQSLSMENLVEQLSLQLDRTVRDQTGLKGKYDFTLKWTPDESPAAMGSGGDTPAAGAAPPSDSSGPSFFTALQEQLGLKLESTKGPVEIIVIDQIERPSEN